MFRMIRFFFLVLLLAPGFARAEAAFYRIADIASHGEEPQLRATSIEVQALYAELARQADVEASLWYSEDTDVNAFATEIDDERVVVVQRGLLDLFADDRDAVAAVLGHELAHHKADHVRAGRRKKEGVRVFGALLGAVVGAKIGRDSGDLAGAVAGTAVGVGAELVALKFNRTQELEADRLGIEWLAAAGFNPQAMLRVQSRLGELGGRRVSMFSTHPTSAKRYKAAEKHIAGLAPPPALLAREIAPLTNADTLLAAQAEIAQQSQARIAEALAAHDTPPAALSLEPVQGYDLHKYAELTHELVQAGGAGKAGVLARYQLDASRLDAITEEYTQRMRTDPGLGRRYTIEYYRTAQGRFAAWGRDLATSYEKAVPLALDPPLDFEVSVTLQAAMHEHFANDPKGERIEQFERDALRAHGLSYYDFLIAQKWWLRRVSIAAMRGDDSQMRRYFEASSDHDETPSDQDRTDNAVSIGRDVRIGENVKIGPR